MSLARAKLLARFPGIDGQIGRGVADFARLTGDGYQIQVWRDIRPASAHVPGIGPWVCFLHGRAPWLEQVTYPLIPDQFNSRPDKNVKPDDAPYRFYSLSECEQEAAKALDALSDSISKLKPRKGGK